MQETWVCSLCQKDPLEEEMATQSNILSWKIPCMEEPGQLQSMGHKELDTTEWLHFQFSNISCMFLIQVSSLFLCASILLPRFWVIFTVIALNYLSDRLLISSSFFDLLGFCHVPSSTAYFSDFSFGLIYCVWCLLSAGLKAVHFSSVQSLSRVWLFVTPWTAVCQVSLSITKS